MFFEKMWENFHYSTQLVIWRQEWSLRFRYWKRQFPLSCDRSRRENSIQGKVVNTFAILIKVSALISLFLYSGYYTIIELSIRNKIIKWCHYYQNKNVNFVQTFGLVLKLGRTRVMNFLNRLAYFVLQLLYTIRIIILYIL